MEFQGYKPESTIIDGPEPPQLRNMPYLVALSELSASVTLVVVSKLWRWEVAGGGMMGVVAKFGEASDLSSDRGPRQQKAWRGCDLSL